MTVWHCVFFSFREDVPQQECDAVFADLAALEQHVEGFEQFIPGPNTSFEGMMRGYTDGFLMAFANREAHLAYHEHEAHKAAGGRLVEAVVNGIDGIMVFDFEA